MELLNRCRDSAIKYETVSETCTCPEFLYRKPWCKHLLSAAIKQTILQDTVYNTLDLQQVAVTRMKLINKQANILQTRYVSKFNFVS